jgi:acyl-homoserine lactone acylase PvdQ
MRSLTILILVLAVGCSGQPAPDTGPALRAGEVAVHRDAWGVPHVYAAREEDGYYGLGYAMAQDQLERTLRLVLYARGTLAQTFGLTPVPGLPEPAFSDYQTRLWRIPEVSAESVARLDPQLKRNYEQFAAGFRAYMDAHPDTVPEWAPRDLSVVDMVAIPRAGLWHAYQAGIGVNDCRRVGVAIPSELPPSGPGGASNVWAVMPERTATGGAILLTDPHGGVDGRFSYEYRLHAGRLRSTGYALGPMMIVARNAHVGWGMTTGSPDVADCFVVETDPDDPRRYLFDGEPREMETQEIVVGVKDGDPIRVTAEYTRHNGYLSPVVARDGNKAYVVTTAYMDDAAPFHNAIYRMNLAGNVDELRDAMSNNGVFPQNVLAADTAGDILFVHAGETPIRPDPERDWTRAVDGNTSETAWQGIHPLDDLLVIRSPASGYLQNNNVDPHFMDEPTPPEVENKPAYILNAGVIPIGRSGSRSIRAVELLSAANAMTREDAFAAALDPMLPGTGAWLAVLEDAVAQAPPADGDAAFVDELLAFDGRLVTDSTVALKYVYWREALREGLSVEDFQSLLGPLWDDAALPAELAPKLVAAAGRAREQLLEVHGDAAAVYGAEFRIGGDDDHSWPLAGGSVGQGPECAMAELMCPAALLAFHHGPRNERNERLAVVGSRIRRIDFYGPNGIESYTAQNPGISDDPNSGHTEDQAERLMSTGEMKKVLFEWSDLEPHIVDSITLTASE